MNQRAKHDPTAPLRERTPEQIEEYLDAHLIMALNAADMLYGDRQGAEDHVRDRLVAISDTWPDPDALAGEDRRQRLDRLRRVIIFGGGGS